MHNQNRQGTLALEKKWNTRDCWFRLFTTLVGMCTIDALKMLNYFKPPHRSDKERRKVLTFAALLAKQLLDNKWEDSESEQASHAAPREMPPPPLLSGNGRKAMRE